MIIIGDLHGKIDILNDIEKLGHEMIFLGDFLDSFTEPVKNQIAVVKRVIELRKEKRARFILGNHELSYINPKAWRCSGFNSEKRFKVLIYIDDLLKYGEHYIELGDNILLTHAGVTKPLWDAKVERVAEEQGIKAARESFVYQMKCMRGSEYSWLYRAGNARGETGVPYGGPFWCDWKEEFRPVPGLIQVCGHTAVMGPAKHFEQEIIKGLRRSPNGDWCIDCLDLGTARTVLLYENGELSPLEF